jgi:hypothetical protein
VKVAGMSALSAGGSSTPMSRVAGVPAANGHVKPITVMEPKPSGSSMDWKGRRSGGV